MLHFFQSLTVDCQESNAALDIVLPASIYVFFITLVSVVFLMEIMFNPDTMDHILIFFN